MNPTNTPTTVTIVPQQLLFGSGYDNHEINRIVENLNSELSTMLHKIGYECTVPDWVRRWFGLSFKTNNFVKKSELYEAVLSFFEDNVRNVNFRPFMDIFECENYLATCADGTVIFRLSSSLQFGITASYRIGGKTMHTRYVLCKKVITGANAYDTIGTETYELHPVSLDGNVSCSTIRCLTDLESQIR